ncbi:MAG: hypothetical protein PHE71_00585 [Candidatus Shapirobacteria bacterium]|nr:hypothetical protein [Candidatus Shapirobacteria bacterium]
MIKNIKKQIDYLIKITDNVGLVEHCSRDVLNYSEGYCVDDNTRAIQICLRFKDKYPKLKKTMMIYFNFLKSAWRNEKYYNDLNQDLIWKEEFFINGEHCGRALAALGEMIKFDNNFSNEAKKMFDQIYGLIKSNNTDYIRVIAQTILGLQYYRQNEIKFWSDKLIAKYDSEKTNDWQWFESEVSYDNGRLPMSLLVAYQKTDDHKIFEVAIESLDFLTEIIFNKKLNCFSFPGNEGWFTKSGLRNIFDQQPIEAGSMVEVYSLAFKITKDKKYKDLALKAFSWYEGNNIIKANMVDSKTGGIYDGFSEKKINYNQGAESVLTYLLAYISIRDIIGHGNSSYHWQQK